MNFLKRWRGISCDEAMQFLQSYLDGEVEDATGRKVAAHLDVCEMCELESSVYDSIKSSLSSLDRPIDPEVLARLKRFTETVANADADN